MSDVKLRTSVAWLMAEKIVRILSGLFVGAAVAKYLGPDEYGSFAVAIATIAMFVAAANMGADHVNISEINKNRSDFSSYLSSIVLARLGWSVPILLLASAYAHYFGGRASGLIDILLWCIPASALGVLSSALLATGKYRAVSAIAIVVLCVSAVVRLYGIHENKGSSFFAWCAAIEAAVLPCLYFLILIGSGAVSKPRYSPHFAKDYIQLCAPIAISAVLINIYLRLELLMVNYIAGQRWAGLWAAALMFITPWNMVAASIMPVANSWLAKEKGGDDSAYESKVVRLVRMMFLLSLGFWGVNCLGASILVPAVLGSQYEEIIIPVMVGSLNLIPLFAGGVQDVWLAHQRKTRIVLKKVLVGIPVSATFLYFGTTYYGLLGAAISMVAANVITTIALNVFVDRRFLRLQYRAMFWL